MSSKNSAAATGKGSAPASGKKGSGKRVASTAVTSDKGKRGRGVVEEDMEVDEILTDTDGLLFYYIKGEDGLLMIIRVLSLMPG